MGSFFLKTSNVATSVNGRSENCTCVPAVATLTSLPECTRISHRSHDAPVHCRTEDGIQQ